MDWQLADCPKCNYVVQKGTKFCPDCGFKLESFWLTREKIYICNGCQAKGDIDHKFCPKCGSRNHMFQKESQSTSEAGKTRKNSQETKTLGHIVKKDVNTRLDSGSSGNRKDSVEDQMAAMAVDKAALDVADAGKMLREVQLKSPKGDIITIDSDEDNSGSSLENKGQDKDRVVKAPPDRYEPCKIGIKRSSDTEETSSETGHDPSPQTKKIKPAAVTDGKEGSAADNNGKVTAEGGIETSQSGSDGLQNPSVLHSTEATGIESTDAERARDGSPMEFQNQQAGVGTNKKSGEKMSVSDDSGRAEKGQTLEEGEGGQTEVTESGKPSDAAEKSNGNDQNGNNVRPDSGEASQSEIGMKPDDNSGTVFGSSSNKKNTKQTAKENEAPTTNDPPRLTVFDSSPRTRRRSVDLSKEKEKQQGDARDSDVGKNEGEKNEKNTKNLKEQTVQTNTSELQTSGQRDGTIEDDPGERMTYASKVKEGTSGEVAQHPAGKFYKKNDNPPDYIPGANANKPKKINTPYGNDSITLNFHVVVSADFHFDQGKDYVQLGSDLDVMANWGDRKLTLNVERQLEGNFVLMGTKVTLPKGVFANGRRVKYKYVVKRPNKLDWELLYQKSEPGTIPNRLFHIPPNELRDKDEWTLYDGVMHCQTEKGKLKKFWNWLTQQEHKHVEKQTKFAATSMLPRWEGLYFGEDRQAGTAHEASLQILRVFQCFKQYFLNDSLDKYNEKPFKEVLYEYIQPRLDQLKKAMAKKDYEETAEEAALRLASSVAIVILCRRFGLQYNHPDIARPLLFGLTIRCDKNTKACIDFEALEKIHFPDQASSIANRLEEFLTEIVKDSANCETDWLRVVPLYHFLKQKSSPHKPLEPSKHHRGTEWWGTTGIDKTVQRFRTIMAYKDEGDMPMNFYIRVLGPLFEVDRLLPRTLVACISWKHLDYLMEKQMIEASVFFASMFYNLVKRNAMYTDIKTVPHLMELLNRKLTNGPGKIEQFCPCPSPMKLQECQCEVEIAMDFIRELLTNCDTTYTHNIVHAATNTLVIVLRTFVAYIEAAKLGSSKESTDTESLTGNFGFLEFEDATKGFVKELELLLAGWLDKALPVSMIERSPFGMKDMRELEQHVFRGDRYSKELQACVEIPDEKYWVCDISLEFFTTDIYILASVEKIFDWLLNQDVPIEKNAWMDYFLNILKHRLEKNRKRERLELFCRVDCDKHHPLIQDLFSKAAFKAIEEGLKNPVAECAFLFDLADRGDAVKFNSLLSRVFKTSWPKSADGKVKMDVPSVLSHILNWNSFVRYLEFFYGMEKSVKLLDGETLELIVCGISVFENIYQDFVSGKITVHLMDMLLPKHEEFTEICMVLDKRSSPEERKHLKGEIIKDIFPRRQAEMDTFAKLRVQLQTFVELCHLVIQHEGDTIEQFDELKQRVETDVHNMRLCDICVPQLPGTNSKPKITWFEVPQEVLAILPALNRMRPCITFELKWKKTGRNYMRIASDEGEDVLMEDIVEHVWSPTFIQVKEIVNSLQKGTITFRTIDQVFGDFKQNYKEMSTEIRAMCKGVLETKTNWISKKLKQIEDYQKLKVYREGACTMKKIKEGFKLEGDFQVLDILISAGDNKNTKLQAINDEVVKSGKALKDLDRKKSNCIEVFHKALPLVTWLKDSVKDTREIKVLVDLAMMSSQGQGDMEVHRAQILHAAAVGYAPLIYELKPQAGFTEFLEKCQQVWRSLESDPKLPDKLEDTARHLDWLKNVKESHGSVELDALSQAENINARGIYYVGCLDQKDETIKQSLEEVLLLKVPPEKKTDINDKEKWRTYKYEKLKDLQSKLMLVAGKAAQGKEQVDRFMEIFDGITRLGTTYVKLCKAGSILFRKWNVTFYCEPNKPLHTVVDFGLSGNKVKQGRSNMTANVNDQIKDLCEFLDMCLEEWQHDINVKRQQFYFLNYFTTEQLVILRREIAACFEAENQEKVSPRIYPMLSSVKRNCTEQDLQDAITKAMNDLSQTPDEDVDMTAEEAQEEEVAGMEVEMDDVVHVEKPGDVGLKYDKAELKKYLEDMRYSGFSEKLALKALEAEEVDGPTCIEEATMWCMDHDEDSSEEGSDEEFMDATSSGSDKDKEERMKEDIGSSVDPEHPVARDYSNVIQRVSLAHLTKTLLEEEAKNRVSLKAELSEVWDNYMKVSATTSVSDFLSVEHLGYILEQLATIEEIERPLPQSLSVGKPNLVVCPQGEMLQYVLSLYMYEGGVTLRVPTSDEVLLCTPNTRLEEVELLFRRAVGMHKEGKIFCVVNADRLDYEVSKRAEKKMEEYAKGIMDYRVVILCSRENEDKSFMVTAYDRYRVKNLMLHQTAAIQTYLKRHFQVTARNQGRNTPAAELDPEKLCVRVVKSERAGVGKSLRAQRLSERIQTHIHLSLHRKTVDPSEVLGELMKHTPKPGNLSQRLIHINIAHEVQEGVDDLLFSLLVLGSLTDQLGYVWLTSHLDLYIIEVMPLQQREITQRGPQRAGVEERVNYVHQVFHYLPSLMCWSPMQSLDILRQTAENRAMRLPDYPEYQPFDQLMDEIEFRSAVWQRVFQYLTCFSTNQSFNLVQATKPQGDMAQCIEIMLRHCGLQDPSWAELRHFVSFLNIQLLDCDHSSFCSAHVAEDLPGFRTFVVKSMIQMSRDFATRSLNISEQTPGIQRRRNEAQDLDIEDFQMKRRWETSPHPYAFFNADHHSMTFLGFNIDADGHMIDQVSGQTLDRNVMPKPLQEALRRNRVPLNENFDSLQRAEKITKLCQVMGNEYPYDPDPTYVLTTDNTKKILAIYMRFRCGIPVIIMGETGCGKTRLVKFMCDLQKPPGVDMNNMVLMKVHGGTTAVDIRKKIDRSVALAKANRTEYPNVDTVVFFDEANTTEEIGLIKQVMCDQGLLIRNAKQYGFKIVAACNPYRKHSAEMIKKLEQAGLGYHIEADQTTDKLGQIPMRRLVYRVQALPKSMIPLVWDFGQLDTQTEQSYIQQMVQKFVVDGALPNMPNIQVAVSKVLTKSQDFMRAQKDECSFVSLRDVERTLKVMAWFYLHRTLLFDLMDNLKRAELQQDGMDEDEIAGAQQPLHEVTRCLVLALGVCYHACLENRAEYRQHIWRQFVQPLPLGGGPDTIFEEINRCQDVFLDQVQLEDNIARNQALKENLFMMIVCIELRIPLFLVGKPGSSKSLAKTIVHDAMQGDAARSELFRRFKLVHMVSYQCSPLSTPHGIVSTFRQCAALQKEKNLDEFVSVVVLDEVGLAEDSPRMPLKTLHHLLEDGCEGDEKSEPHMKVAFIGISNWALDPAKMNRGILVQRGVPDNKELQDSAEGICARNKQGQNNIRPYIKPMAQAYLELYSSALKIREFFGLRDFYSIIKMVYSFSKRSGKPPTWYELKHSILRNFGGLDGVDPMAVFEKHLIGIEKNMQRQEQDPDCSPEGLIWACLFGEGLEDIDCESRYLLILTENYAALKILQQQLTRLKDAIYIFGSSFPKDQEYTQVCRNINRIKVCMETGQTVVLLNLENLYESLYDALNQYYVYLGGQRFVDLGLGSHRVKCKVHEDFRLIVVAEKQVVYKKFPIPLINRLEKHTLTMETVLSEDHQELARQLDHWAKAFADVDMTTGKRANKFTVGDVFIGYDKDTACSVVLQVSQQLGEDASPIEILEKSQEVLLQCATPEAIVRLKKSRLQGEEFHLSRVYFEQQQHDSLFEFLLQQLGLYKGGKDTLFAQVSTHAKLLSRSDCQQMARKLGLSRHDLTLESLQEFHTEQQFCKQLSKYFEKESDKDQLLILQCDSGDENATLIASAQHSIVREFRNQEKGQIEGKTLSGKKHVVFIIQLPRRPGGCFVGFQGGEWMSYHIDDLRAEKDTLPSLVQLKENSVGVLFEKSVGVDDVSGPEPMEQEEKGMEEAGGVGSSGDGLEEFADMPPLEGYTEEDYIKAGHKPARKEAVDENSMEVDEAIPVVNEQGDRAETAAQRPHDNHQQVEMTDADDNTKFNVAAIIKNCIHGAASMVEDAEQNMTSPRKTKRVQLLLQLLQGKGKEGGISLMLVLKKRVVQLLKDKEHNTTTPERARQWLTNEAASSEAISRAGTFRRSVWQNIEAKVTPLLAYIMAYCDPNANLDLLTSQSTEAPWLEQYWLKVLASGDIASLTYQDLQTASQRREVERFLVANHGCQETNFKCQLPFSWLLKDKVDLMVHKMKSTPEGENPLGLVVKMFHKSSEGRLILSAVGSELEQAYDIFVQKYLADYVRMVHKCYSNRPDLEYQLIEESIRVAALEEHTLSAMFSQAHESDEETDDHNLTGSQRPMETFLLSIPLVHVTYQRLSGRLRLFCQAVEALPEAVQALHEFKQMNGDHELNSKREFTLDILMLHFILENLAPKKEEINDLENRFDWIGKVKRMSPVVERMLASASESVPDRHAFGEMCMKFLTKCRAMWCRVYAVQLFIEHVCPRDVPVEKLSTKKVLPLWTALGDDTDFQKVKSLEKLEQFLKICNKNANKHYFGESKDCEGCSNILTDPVTIPCHEKHVVCSVCIETQRNLQQPRCPICFENLPEDFKPEVKKQKADARDGYAAYRQRCNAFFMELVSSLCFPGDVPPENAVIQKLLKYVTKETKDSDKRGRLVTQRMNVFQDSIDPTPVVRSFLLQLLLRSDVDQVKEYLQLYFENARRIVKDGNQEQLAELCLLFVHCLEDANHTQFEQEVSLGRSVRLIKDLLEAASGNMNSMALHVQKLEGIAGARFGLYICADWMNKIHITKQMEDTGEMRKVFECAARLCNNAENKWPRLYLLRQISRRFGMDALLKLGDVQTLKWILPPEARQNKDEGQPDRFIICEDFYRETREALTLSLLDKDFEKLNKALKESKTKNATLKERNMMLALYTEVTMASRLPEDTRGLKPERIEELREYLAKSKVVKQKQLANSLLENNLGNGCLQLQIAPNQDRRMGMIAQLVVHHLVTLNVMESTHFIEPLIVLMKNPGKMANCFLPTMPQDDLEYIHESLMGARNQNMGNVRGVDHNPVFYHCPEGHPYIIGDCGRPTTAAKCNVCGRKIGGRQYQLEAGNSLMKEFNTAKSHGHILGPARQRSQVPVPERKMTAAMCSTLRLMSHMSMYLAANENAEAVGGLVVPGITGRQAGQYFWDQIEVDLAVLAKALNRSPDDSVLLLHAMLDNLVKKKENGRGIDPSLKTKKAREEWEKRFCDVYIAPFLQGLETRLHDANQRILGDDRLGSNPLLKILYQADVTPDDLNIERLQQIPSIWRIRSRVTIEHLNHELRENIGGQENDKKVNLKRGKGKAEREHPILMLFLQHEPLLRGVHFLPSIVRLQRLLVQRFHGAIDRAEATQLKVGHWVNRKVPAGPMREEFQLLIENFSQAWMLAKAHLASFGFGGKTLPKEYTNMKIDYDTPLAMLLPSYKGQGLCSIALVHFLTAVQNDFLENYSGITKISLSEHTSVHDATTAHLVSFLPDRDLLPLVLANCNYSLSVGGGDSGGGEAGQGTSLQYDFRGLEKRIEEKFIRGRTRLRAQVEPVVFRADFTNAAVFETIRKKINQESLDSSVQQQVVSESRHLTEVTDSLATLDIALGFLVSVGGEGETKLADFISKTLEMSKSLHSNAAMRNCRLKHVQALWLLLSQERAKIQAKYGQDALDNVAMKYHEELSQDQIAALHNALQYCNPEHLLSELYECIMLQISVPQDENDPDYMDNSQHPLGYVLTEYLESKDNAGGENVVTDRFPDDILLKHSVNTWLHIHRYITQTS